MFPLVQPQNRHQQMEGSKHLDWRANVPPAALRTLSFRTTIDNAKTWCWWWWRKSLNFTIIIIMSKLWQFKSELVTLGAGLWTASPLLLQLLHPSCTKSTLAALSENLNEIEIENCNWISIWYWISLLHPSCNKFTLAAVSKNCNLNWNWKWIWLWNWDWKLKLSWAPPAAALALQFLEIKNWTEIRNWNWIGFLMHPSCIVAPNHLDRTYWKGKLKTTGGGMNKRGRGHKQKYVALLILCFSVPW